MLFFIYVPFTYAIYLLIRTPLASCGVCIEEKSNGVRESTAFDSDEKSARGTA
jgi:hypothetical protein